MVAQRILVLAPHPDDEVVAYGAAIGRARAEGSEVFVVFLTHGCPERSALWPWQRKGYAARVVRRQREAEEVARLLGVTLLAETQRPARRVRHEGEAVLREVRAALDAHAITHLWVPAYEGGNADHDMANGIGSVMDAIGWSSADSQGPRVWEFAAYNWAGGRVGAQTFPEINGTETTLTLTPEEQALKKRLLALYASERDNLGYVGTTRECFRPLARYDYTRPPHPGTVWYARFQWVPFRHPRLDFTRPTEVSAAIEDLGRRWGAGAPTSTADVRGA